MRLVRLFDLLVRLFDLYACRCCRSVRRKPTAGGSIGSLRGNVLVASEPTDDGRPTGGGAADKFGIQHGQTEETQATERPDTLEALHFEKALSAMLKDGRLRGMDTGSSERLQGEVFGEPCQGRHPRASHVSVADSMSLHTLP